MEFKVKEDESYFQIHDFSVEDYLQEASFSMKHFCGTTVSETSISRGELDALSEIEDFTSIWPRMEDAYLKSKEGGCEKEQKPECGSVESCTNMLGRRVGGPEEEALTFEQVSFHFMEFKVNEEESYFQIVHDFSVDDCLQEASFSMEHFCAVTISEGSISQDELEALSDIEDFTNIWPQIEYVYQKNKEGGCKKGSKLECGRVKRGKKMLQRQVGGLDKKALTFEQVALHFNMPIKQAARELNVGLTVLKKRCRELHIPRWPHRKVKSLQTLINNVQELGHEEGHLTRTVVEKLQQTKKLMEESPAMMLDAETKVLRQACFKENFKRKRLMGHGKCPWMALISDAER